HPGCVYNSIFFAMATPPAVVYSPSPSCGRSGSARPLPPAQGVRCGEAGVLPQSKGRRNQVSLARHDVARGEKAGHLVACAVQNLPVFVHDQKSFLVGLHVPALKKLGVRLESLVDEEAVEKELRSVLHEKTEQVGTFADMLYY